VSVNAVVKINPHEAEASHSSVIKIIDENG
jgi:hypothetical protein